MRAFEIIINGNRICLAGINGNSVLTGIVTSHVRSQGGVKTNSLQDLDMSLDLTIGGLEIDSGSSFHWPKVDLCVGDEVLIKVVDAETVDEPVEKATA